MSWEEFTSTPSRLTTQPVDQSERGHMLQDAARDGLIRNYQGIRISKTKKRFLVEQATVWNVIDRNKNKIGQAATFSKWTPVIKK